MNKKQTNILFIFMVVIAIVILIGTGAYAYYRTTISGTTSGTIARWSFKANDQIETFNLDLGKIYPGKSGVYNIELSAEDSDLDVYYELVFDYMEKAYAVITSFDSNYQKEITSSTSARGYAGRYGIISAGQTLTIPIYYNWPYDDNPNDLTHNAPYDANIKIIARQITGYSGETPMYLTTFISAVTPTYSDGYITVVGEK